LNVKFSYRNLFISICYVPFHFRFYCQLFCFEKIRGHLRNRQFLNLPLIHLSHQMLQNPWHHYLWRLDYSDCLYYYYQNLLRCQMMHHSLLLYHFLCHPQGHLQDQMMNHSCQVLQFLRQYLLLSRTLER
jgi:hypothetical protein